MIQKKISYIKQLSTMKIEIEAEKLETITIIENLLTKLDFNSEVVPTNNLEKLINLLTSLKGEALNHQEKELVLEISES